MLTDKMNDRYQASFRPAVDDSRPARYLIFHQRRVFLNCASGEYTLPLEADIRSLQIPVQEFLYFGEFDGHPCFCMEREVEDTLPGFTLLPVRELVTLTGDAALFQIVGTAMHLAYWNRMNRFCGCCGSRTADKSDERAKLCPSCGAVVYPRISPATITAIVKDDEILLAHNSNFKAGMYSIIAGFVEPGESLEECVRREVYEETGIQIKNIRYFGSQPWPFPDSLMLGFTAEYVSGEVCADGVELTDARFWKVDELPDIPAGESIAGKMIRRIVNTIQSGKRGNQ